MTLPAIYLRSIRPVRWTYYFTDFRLGRLLAVLPLLDVSLSDVLSGAASGTAKIPLADPTVRARNPFAATVPRRTCMWAQREELNPANGSVARSDTMWGGIVVGRARQRATRMMTLNLVTWPSYFNNRLVGDLTYTQADKFKIQHDLFSPAAQQPPDPTGLYPVIPPHLAPLTAPWSGIGSGVLADRTYVSTDLKKVSDAAVELGNSGDGFNWHLTPYRDSSVATVGESFKVRLDMGYPRLGRVQPAGIRWSDDASDTRRRWGFVSDYTITEDGSAVYNKMTALGSGSGPSQLRSTKYASDVGNDELNSGYPLYEASLMSSTQDDTTQDTVDGKALGALRAGFASQVKLTNVKVRGDLAPYVWQYAIGDDVTLAVDEFTTGQPATITGQLVGRTLLPPQQGRTEMVQMDVQGTLLPAST